MFTVDNYSSSILMNLEKHADDLDELDLPSYFLFHDEDEVFNLIEESWMDEEDLWN